MSIALKQKDIIKEAAAELRSWGAVAIIGAGASLAAGFPLTAQLQSLLWQTLDSDKQLRASLALDNGWSEVNAKMMIANDPLRMDKALNAIAKSPAAREVYQRGFSLLNNERVARPSLIHDALAELLHRRIIEFVVSLNWDTLLEAAYRRRYGSTLRADGDWLYKPHGDAAHPETPWILPHESGYIPDSITQRVKALVTEYPRALLIVGYSESDEEVVSKLIGPLSDRWKVIRIGPSAIREMSIAMPAKEALPLLLEAIDLDIEVPGWEYINFDNQHDLGAALAGRGLRSSDVKACPRLPEVSSLKQTLLVTKSAVVIGKSGSGKSITAYQATYDLSQDGWEVLVLTEPDHDVEELVYAVSNLPRKSVLIVDDAQALKPKLVHRLLALASSSLAVIVVSTDDVAQKHDIEVVGSRAVATIAEALKARRSETLAIVQKLDSLVGEGYLDISLDDRLEEAAKQDLPWQFSFVLTGGERRSAGEIAALKDRDRTDILLAAIAAGQIISLDGGVTLAWLEKAAETLGKDSAWLDQGIKVLLTRRLLISERSFRLPHLRFAVAVLRYVCKSRKDPAWEVIVSMLRECILYKSPPLRGVSWLLNELKYTDAIWHRGFDTVIDDDTWKRLLERCWVARGSIERRDAVFVLEALVVWHKKHIEHLGAQAKQLGRWLEEVDTDSAYSLAIILNNLYHDIPELSKSICNESNPEIIADRLAKIQVSEAYNWGYLLAHLSVATSDWKDRLVSVLDVVALRALIQSADMSDLYRINQLILGVYILNRDLGLELAELAIPTISDAINSHPIRGYTQARDIIDSVLGYIGKPFLRRDPSRRQRQIGRKLAQALDPYAIAQALSISCRREWQEYERLFVFIKKADNRKARAISKEIDFTKLDKITISLWEQMPRDLYALIWGLSVLTNWGSARTWVNQHGDEILKFDARLAAIAPESAAKKLRSGRSLNLFDEGDSGWTIAILALHGISEVDKELAVQVIRENQTSIGRRFVNLSESSCTGLIVFLKAMREHTPDILEDVINAINPVDAEKNWSERLRGKAVERTAVSALLEVISSSKGPLAAIAAELRFRDLQASTSKK